MVKDFFSSSKKIYDSLHGFIRFEEVEKALIDHFAFQRLRFIHQLGGAYFVYPGATHSRFEHSLGVMELSTRIYEKICKSGRPDLFHLIPRKDSSEYLYWRQILRLAALCHDLGHLPFSHVAEKDLLGSLGHEEWTMKILQSPYLNEIWEQLSNKTPFQRICKERKVAEDVLKISIGKEKLRILFSKEIPFSPWEEILSEIISGDFFGADRIDYLLRDAKATGIVYGLFDFQQLIETLCILPSLVLGKEVALGIDEKGLESCEALLLARHFMHKRVYQYSSVLAYNFHLKRFMRLFYKERTLFQNLESFLLSNDDEISVALQKAAIDSSSIGHEDAKRLLFRKNRFKAIPLPPGFSEEKIQKFKEQYKISDRSIEWEIHRSASLDLSFPVARRYLKIQKANECSSLLAQIPSVEMNWVFLDPEYEILFLQSLKSRV